MWTTSSSVATFGALNSVGAGIKSVLIIFFMGPALDAYGPHQLINYCLIGTAVCRGGRPLPGKTFDVLNEVVVDRGPAPFLSMIECYERDRLITKVQGDGVMLATPTGSTAYRRANPKTLLT